MTEGHDPRPRPQYGEYADDHDAAAQSGQANGAQPVAAPPAAAQPAPTDHPNYSTPTQLPGVPHNLGVRPDREAARRATQGSRGMHAAPGAGAQPPAHGEPYRAVPPTSAPSSPHQQPQAQQPQQPLHQASMQQSPQHAHYAAAPVPLNGRPAAHTGDRIVTILLLVVGGYFALSSAYSMMTLGQSLTEIAVGAFQIENFVLPSSVSTLGTVGAITLLALYAVVLIFSIRRMRARKITFWAPLAAGALAMIIMFALFAIALSQSPELLHAGTQPEAMQQMLDYAESQGL